MSGEPAQGYPCLERGLGLCQAAAILTWFPSVAAALGYAYTLSGRVLEAFPLLQPAVAQDTPRGISAGHARRVAYPSEAYLLAGHIGEAIPRRHCPRVRPCLKARGNEAYALWLLGEIHAQQDPLADDAADTYYQQALVLAEELGMRPLQAHCHLALGTLYTKRPAGTGRIELSTAIELYRAMEMIFWLPRARPHSHRQEAASPLPRG